MEYYCELCDRAYTIPIGDILIEKDQSCGCGRPAKHFKLTTIVIVKSHRPCGSSSKPN